jgi:hypothetical protein
MRKVRFTIGWLMILVLVLAVGLAALKSGDEPWAGVMFLLTCGVLGLAVIGALCRREAERAWWLGFAVFGWGYMVLAFWLSEYLPKLPTLTLLEVLYSKFRPSSPFDGFGPAVMGAFGGSSSGGSAIFGYARSQIIHCLWALLFATIGGLLARAFFGSPDGRPANPEPAAQSTSSSPPSRWLRPTIVAMTVAILLTSIAATWSRPAAGLWAGVTFYLTCILLGLAILGTLVGRGRRPVICMGAALFGAGYMLLAFGGSSDRPRPAIATDLLLNAIRPRFPLISESTASQNARILDELNRPIPMPFPNETPLDDVLKYIKVATSSPGYRGIPIYVNPIGLQEAERSLNSTVTVDLEGVPLKTTLKLCLKQLGLDCSVQDGYLRITSEDEHPATVEDPFLIVGHCLLSLIAAAIGGALAPLVSVASRDRPGRTEANEVAVSGRSH